MYQTIFVCFATVSNFFQNKIISAVELPWRKLLHNTEYFSSCLVEIFVIFSVGMLVYRIHDENFSGGKMFNTSLEVLCTLLCGGRLQFDCCPFCCG